MVQLAELSEDPENARKHSERNIEAIVRSLRQFGQQKPIVITPDKVVRAGNGTLIAARRLGWSALNCAITTLSSADELRAYAIADNRVGELSDFDDAILAQQLAGLFDEKLVEAVGFDEAELADLQAALYPDHATKQSGKSDGRRNMGRRPPSVRVMISIAQAEEFERAIRATGLMNRGDALLAICRHYLTLASVNDDDGATGQLDARAEAALAQNGIAELAT